MNYEQGLLLPKDIRVMFIDGGLLGLLVYVREENAGFQIPLQKSIRWIPWKNLSNEGLLLFELEDEEDKSLDYTKTTFSSREKALLYFDLPPHYSFNKHRIPKPLVIQPDFIHVGYETISLQEYGIPLDEIKNNSRIKEELVSLGINIYAIEKGDHIYKNFRCDGNTLFFFNGIEKINFNSKSDS